MPASFSRVFINGNSQTAQTPQELMPTTSRVEILPNADGDLALHPSADRGAALLDALKSFDDEFVSLLEAGLRLENWARSDTNPP
jgi:virulence-associated protein VagC